MKVELITYTPEPDDVCGVAARTCVSETIPPKGDLFGDWSKSQNALRHALESGHESVAEHAVFTFAVEGISRACSHQLVRHRMASYSQQSQRYVKMSGKVNESQFDFVTPKSIDKASDDVFNEYLSLMIAIDNTYRSFIERGIPEEDARYILPNACCTNIVVTMNGRELRHFFKLRCCNRAQWEIRELANQILEQVKEVAPVLFENAGPSCVATGRCPEKQSCGRVKE